MGGRLAHIVVNEAHHRLAAAGLSKLYGLGRRIRYFYLCRQRISRGDPCKWAGERKYHHQSDDAARHNWPDPPGKGGAQASDKPKADAANCGKYKPSLR